MFSWYLIFLKRLSHCIIFLYFFALITEERFLILSCYSFLLLLFLAFLWNSTFKWVCLSFSSLPFTSNQSEFGIDHLVMSMCRFVSGIVGTGCLLWPVGSLGKLLTFALLHFVLQGLTSLLLQVSLDFQLLHSNPLL